MTRTTNSPLRVGLLGAGMVTTVSYGFLPGLVQIKDRAQVVAITSRTRALAERVASDWAIPTVYDDLASMLADDTIDAVVNATPGPVHFETNMQILDANKHLVTDKPLALTVAEADEICALAQEKGLLVISAPAEMLTADWTEARRLIRAGAIGKVAFARVQSSHCGPAAMSWPVDPSPYYHDGQGSLFEMGVYGIDRITSILGPAKRVSAFGGIANPHPIVNGGPFHGKVIDATIEDTVLVLLDFGDSTFAVVDGCFTVAATKSPPMELFGVDGTLIVRRPDASVRPGQFWLELFSKTAGPELPGWISPQTVAVGFQPADDRGERLQRGALIDHLVDCLHTGKKPAVAVDRARHVLEIMVGATTATREGRVIDLETTFSTDY
jgi:predicted dehydrogenase